MVVDGQQRVKLEQTLVDILSPFILQVETIS